MTLERKEQKQQKRKKEKRKTEEKKNQEIYKEIHSWYVLLLGLRTPTKRESPRKFQDLDD